MSDVDAWAVAVLDAWRERDRLVRQYVVGSRFAKVIVWIQQCGETIGGGWIAETAAEARLTAACALVAEDPSLAPSPHPVMTSDRERYLVRVIRTTGDGFVEALDLLLLRANPEDRVLLEKLLAVAQNLRVCPLSPPPDAGDQFFPAGESPEERAMRLAENRR